MAASTTVQGWQISSLSEGLTSLATSNEGGDPSTLAGKPHVAVVLEFQDKAPVALRVVQGTSTEQVRFFFDVTATNNAGAGVELNAFNMSLFDGFTDPNQQAPSGPTHPGFAHYHDSDLAGWADPTLGIFTDIAARNNTTQSPTSVNKSNQITIFGGTDEDLVNGATTAFTDLGVHQFARSAAAEGLTGNTGEFHFIVTPDYDLRADYVQEGGGSADTIVSNDSNNGTFDDYDHVLFGYGGNDTLSGGTGQNVLVGGTGDDRLVLDDFSISNGVFGQDGVDTVVLSGARSAYTVSDRFGIGGYDFFLSKPGSNGTLVNAQIDGVERFQFSDVTLSAADVVRGGPPPVVVDPGPVVDPVTPGGNPGADIDWNALADRVQAYFDATGSWGLLSEWLSDNPPDRDVRPPMHEDIDWDVLTQRVTTYYQTTGQYGLLEDWLNPPPPDGGNADYIL